MQLFFYEIENIFKLATDDDRRYDNNLYIILLSFKELSNSMSACVNIGTLFTSVLVFLTLELLNVTPLTKEEHSVLIQNI